MRLKELKRILSSVDSDYRITIPSSQVDGVEAFVGRREVLIQPIEENTTVYRILDFIYRSADDKKVITTMDDGEYTDELYFWVDHNNKVVYMDVCSDWADGLPIKRLV